MTTTHPDLTALLAAVCQFPDDDTPRLVLADWLDEHEQHERAEFIRVQVELARLQQNEEATEKGDREAYMRLRRLIGRQAALLSDPDRHVGWVGVRCPACKGAGAMVQMAYPESVDDPPQHEVSIVCGLCNGTRLVASRFARGFVDRVTCRMGDVLRPCECGECGGLETILTDWARGVLAAHPVTRWEIVDREPWTSHASAYWGWWSENPPHPPDASTLPHVVMAALAGDSRRIDSSISLRYTPDTHPPGGTVLFATEAEARDALALAVGRVARRLAGLEVTP